MTLERRKPKHADRPAPIGGTPVTLEVPVSKDEPINSRNSPTTLNILTSSTEKEDFANSMLCLEQEMEQLSMSPAKSSVVTTATTNGHAQTATTKSAPASPTHASHSDMDVGYRDGGQRGFFDGLLGCLRPVWTILGKATAAELKQQDDWEIPFESISDLQWLGSGAQGAVFLGRLSSEQVAVKKVRDVKETDIRHLRRLNHPNIISFKGVCTQSPCYCIIMEYCPYGQLYEILRDGKEIPPLLRLDWAKQIANGMNYLHSHKIIHRDLKSPNVLIAKNDIIRISDFGTSREWNEKSTKMSFAGTVAWMAPEVIRNEPCSEKVDIWSYGVVLWELLTNEVPYRDVDSSAIIWGVGSNSLHLPVPSTCPEGFKLLMRQCWSAKPRNRPSFRQIQMHLEIASPDLLTIPQDEFFELQIEWKEEIKEQLQKIKSEGSHMPQLEEELIRRRRDELRHAQDVREHYERKLERANNLYMELTACMLQLEKRERELIKREQALQSYSKRRKSILKPVIKAQEKIERIGKKRAHKCISDPGTSPDGPAPNGSFVRMAGNSTQASPSPSRSRSRKSRHRGSHSARAATNPFTTSPTVQSPTKDALHQELELKTAAINHKDGTHVTPSSLKHLSSEEALSRREDDGTLGPPHIHASSKNLNDVCFGCNGGCSDVTCSSKRSSHVSADVESNTGDTPCTSPTQGLDLHDLGSKGQKDDSTNSNVQTTDTNENHDSENGNSQSDSPKKEPRSPKSPRTRNSKRTKRLRSSEEEQQPNKLVHCSNSLESEQGGAEGSSPVSTHSHKCLEQLSGEDGEVEDSEDDMRRRNRNRQNYVSFHPGVALSEEDNTSERSSNRNATDQMMSSLSAENLQLELSHCNSDGLSDKENIVRRMKHQVKHSPDRGLPTVDTDSSESDE